MGQNLIEFLANCPPVRFQLRAPGKLRRGEKLMIANERITAHQDLDPFDDSPAASEDEVFEFRVQFFPPDFRIRPPILRGERSLAT